MSRQLRVQEERGWAAAEGETSYPLLTSHSQHTPPCGIYEAINVNPDFDFERVTGRSSVRQLSRNGFCRSWFYFKASGHLPNMQKQCRACDAHKYSRRFGQALPPHQTFLVYIISYVCHKCYSQRYLTVVSFRSSLRLVLMAANIVILPHNEDFYKESTTIMMNSCTMHFKYIPGGSRRK